MAGTARRTPPRGLDRSWWGCARSTRWLRARDWVGSRAGVVAGLREGVSMGSYSQQFTDQVVELHRRDGSSFHGLGERVQSGGDHDRELVRAAEKRNPSPRVTGPPVGPSPESDQAKMTASQTCQDTL